MEVRIKATCDNSFVLRVDGKKVLESRTWRRITSGTLNLKPGEHEFLFTCLNYGGPAGLAATIEYGETLESSCSGWEVSRDNKTWKTCREIGDMSVRPWNRVKFGFGGDPRWVWAGDMNPRQTVYVRRTIHIPESQVAEDSQDSQNTPKELPDVEATEDTRITDISAWESLNSRIALAANETVQHNNLLIDFEKFITPNEDAVKSKVKELGNDPVKCYRFVSDKIKYVSDSKNYLKDEYWCYPKETLKKGSGDCEDQAFLIASMFSLLGIECFVRTAYLLAYGGGHAWCYFKLNGKWVAAECTSSSFNPWGSAKEQPYYGPYIPWIDIKIGESHDFTGTELLKHALRLKAGEYDDGKVRLAKEVTKNRQITSLKG